jgi:tetratricopeptide (TPR) repeat protein
VFQVELAFIWLGWSIHRIGHVEGNKKEILKGVSIMTEHISKYIEIGCNILVPHLRSLLAEGFQAIKQYDQSLELIDRALEQIRDNGERYYEPEIRRLKGRILAESRKSGLEAAISCYRMASDCAEQQRSLVFRRRALAELKSLGHSHH